MKGDDYWSDGQGEKGGEREGNGGQRTARDMTEKKSHPLINANHVYHDVKKKKVGHKMR